MITAEALRQHHGVTGAADLFQRLGYPVLLQQLDPAEWPRSDVSVQLADDWSLYHGSRIGPIDLFFLRADAANSRETCSSFVSAYRRWNVLARPLVVAGTDGHLAIHGIDKSGRTRRLDVDLAAPRKDLIDRLNLLAISDASSFTELRRRFDRAFEKESITSRFFSGFRTAVESLSEHVAAQCNEKVETIRDYSLLILSRVLFLYFLQQKGWLDGNPRFLSRHLSAAIENDRDFFATVLQPLFFGCLNTPVHSRTAVAHSLGRIPYLNGGLFEPSLFEQRNGAISFSNEVIAPVINDLFEQYSFCVDERDGGGMHIDPEMLGRVFESLMADEERLASGTFYTPKQIVDAMTEESIIASICDGDREVESALRRNEAFDETTRARLRERLERIRVIDPACGSGAFLLSSLHTIERLLRMVSDDISPNLRQRIVERSLYGVDVKPEAVRLCELRMWLAIVSNSDATPETVEPLPNLDRNILQGNALLGPLDFLGTTRRDVYHRWAYALRSRRALFDRYRRSTPVERPALSRAIRESDQALATALLGSALKSEREELERLTTPVKGLFGPIQSNPALRQQLLDRIDSIERHLARVQDGVIDFFAFDLHFADVFADGGFDVVTGNPPWVRSSRIEPETRRTLGERYDLYQSGRGFDQSDLCVAFWEKAFTIAAEGGIVSLLLPSKVLTASYGAALRSHILNSAQLIAIEDWSDRARDLFEADTFPVALTVRRESASPKRPVVIRSAESTYEIAPDRLSSGDRGSAWRVIPPEVLELIDRIGTRCRSTSEVLRRRPLMGIKTGANERFFLDEVEFINGNVRVPSLGINLPAEGVARCVRGRDVERWKVSGATWMLLPPRNIDGRKNSWVHRAAEAIGIPAGELRLSYVQPEHFGIKVAWKDLSCGLQAVVLPSTTEVKGRLFNVVPNQTLYFVEATDLQEAYALSAIFNSTIFNALVVSSADRAKDAHFRYFAQSVGAVPLPPVENDETAMRTLARLARRAHGGSDVQHAIDTAVAQLYAVTRSQFRVLKRFLDARLRRG